MEPCALPRGIPALTDGGAHSPNCGPRRGGVRPDMVVLHYTAMANCAAARARLCDPAAEVSAHYLIAASGTIDALVPEGLRAWHAGVGAWGAVSDVNSRSIGIEMDNPGDRPFPAVQMAALERLLRGILARWRIPPERVIGHSDMAPERKSDPGARFDWRVLAVSGLSVWPRTPPGHSPPADPARFAADLGRFGYPPAPDAVLLRAFRLRFRPQARGPLSPDDMAAAVDLAARFPVDRVGPRP